MYFIAQIVSALTIRNSFSWFHSHSNTTKYSRLILFPPAALESAISQKSLAYFHWRTWLETKIWTLGMLIAFRSSQQLEQRTTCMYTNTHTYTYLDVFMYPSVFILSSN